MRATRLVLVPERRDKRGRRIGRNWWREYINDLLLCEEIAWQARRESGMAIHTDQIAGADYDTGYYQLTEGDYRSLHPRPTLKALLVGHAGTSQISAA
jgi:hypothetical protein